MHIAVRIAYNQVTISGRSNFKFYSENLSPSTIYRKLSLIYTCLWYILVDDVLLLFERVIKHLSDKLFKPELIRAIINLNAALKIHGEQIEALDKDLMDKYQVKYIL